MLLSHLGSPGDAETDDRLMEFRGIYQGVQYCVGEILTIEAYFPFAG